MDQIKTSILQINFKIEVKRGKKCGTNFHSLTCLVIVNNLTPEIVGP